VVKGSFIFLFLFIYELFLNFYQPYHDSSSNKLDLLQTKVCEISVMLGVFLALSTTEYLIILGILILAVSNFYYFLTM